MAVLVTADNKALFINAKSTYLTNNYVSGTSVFSVASSVGFATDQFVVFGELGNETSEIIRLSGAGNNTLTGTTVSVFAHPESTRVTILQYNQVRFYWTATATFDASTVISTSDLQVDDFNTKILDSSNSTGFGWFKYYNSLTAGLSDASAAIPYADYAENSVKRLLDTFFSGLNNREQTLISLADALRYLNEGYARARNHLNLVNTEYNVNTVDITVAASTAEYTWASLGITNFGNLISLHDSSGQPIDHIDIWDLPFYRANSGNAPKYYLRNSSIGFAPTPAVAATYTAYYKEITTSLTSLYDTLDFPDNNFFPILDWMMYRACPKLNKSQSEAAAYMAAFNDGVNLMKVTSIKQNANLDTWSVSHKANV